MSKASGKDRQLRRQSAAKENKKERKIEPWRIIVGTVSIAFIMFLWVSKRYSFFLCRNAEKRSYTAC